MADCMVSFAQQNLKLDTAENAQTVIDQIASNVAEMTTLNFSGNTMGIEAATAIKEILKKAPKLQRLLWFDMFTGRLKTEIGPALRQLSEGLMFAQVKLVEINLSDNAFGPNGIVGVTDLLASSACYSLQVLILNNEGLGHQGCNELVDALNKCVTESAKNGTPLKLRVFSAGRNRLENHGAGLLADLFARIGTLEELSLYQNGIGIHGPVEVVQLLESLIKNPKLRKLDLSDNSLKPSGAAALAKILPHLNALEDLNLSDCLIKSKGCQDLTVAFSPTPDNRDRIVCPQLQRVDLSGNEFKSQDGLLLIQSLIGEYSAEGETAFRRKLRRINLNTNGFGENAIENMRVLISNEGLDTSSILGSFSDDEGSATDSCDDDEVAEDYDQEEESEEEATQESPDQFYGKSVCSPSVGGNDVSTQLHTSITSNVSVTEAAANFSFNRSLFGASIINTGSHKVESEQKENLFSGLAGAKVNTLFAPSLFNVPTQPNPEFFKKFRAFVSTPSATDAVAVLNDGHMEVSLNNASTLTVAMKEVLKTQPTVRIEAVCLLVANASVHNLNATIRLAALLLKEILLANPSEASNDLLVQMRLIKSEDKKFKPACNDAARLVMLAKQLLLVEGKATAVPLPPSVVVQVETVLRTLNTRLKQRLKTPQEQDDLDDLMNNLSKLKVDE